MDLIKETKTDKENYVSTLIQNIILPVLNKDESPITTFESVEPARSSIANLKNLPFSMGEVLENMKTIRKLPRSYFKNMEKMRVRTADFRDKYILPVADEIEKRVAKDPNYFPYDIIKKGAPYKFSTLMIPRALGGPGFFIIHSAIMAEELAAGCGGLATSLAVSSAGSSQVLLAMEPHLIAVYMRESIKAEKQGEPILWSGAVTEPNAGTDRWDEDYQNYNKAGMVAKKVKGGYILNGTKCFVSNGSVSKRAVITGFLDPHNPRETGLLFIVKTDSPGFSVGRVERKMGQKASQTSEQICDNLFVPDSHVIGPLGLVARGTTTYLAASRGPVGAIGVGCGRRALESLVQWASERKNRLGNLLDQQALQMKIAQMTQDIIVARNAYIQACIAFDEMFYGILSRIDIMLALWLIPKFIMRSEPFRKIVQSNLARKFLYRYIEKGFPYDKLMHAAGLAAIAKVVGSTTGRRIAGEVMEIMGPEAADPRWGVDKAYRDARLTEIYEGTNEVCTITIFKSMACSLDALRK